jgi:phosphonate transport system ATP-binding protein
LLRSICGLELLGGKDSAVALFGETLQSGGVLSPEVRTLRRQTGIIFQQFNLVGRMGLLSNVLTGLLPHMPLWRVLSDAFTHDQKLQALQALDSVGLADYALQRASTLSGGQQQRAAVARALLQGARILLADEPVASLDPESARKVMHLLKQLNQQNGMTLVVSLHNVAMARQYCSRIVALRAGAVVFDGPPTSLTDTHVRDLYGSHSDELLLEEGHVPRKAAHHDIPVPV